MTVRRCPASGHPSRQQCRGMASHGGMCKAPRQCREEVRWASQVSDSMGGAWLAPGTAGESPPLSQTGSLHGFMFGRCYQGHQDFTAIVVMRGSHRL